MAKLNKPAILVVDMLNDFVTGALTGLHTHMCVRHASAAESKKSG